MAFGAAKLHRAESHRRWRYSQPRGPFMALLCNNEGSCGGTHAALLLLTSIKSLIGAIACGLLFCRRFGEIVDYLFHSFSLVVFSDKEIVLLPK